MPEEQVTIRKGTFNKMLGGLVMALIVVAFAGGYILGEAGITGKAAGSGTITADDNGNPPDTAPNPPAPSGPMTIDIAGDPTIGSKTAKILFVEFSDFQCPYCRRFYTQSFAQLKTDYMDTGKVLYAYKNFPLSFHEGALPYANAAECANEQGKWEQMHNKILDEQNKRVDGNVAYVGDATVKQWAADIGLDTAKFNSRFDSKEHESEIQKDFQWGQAAGVEGTPTFFIGNDKIGYVKVVGAQPYSVIKQAIDQQLVKI